MLRIPCRPPRRGRRPHLHSRRCRQRGFWRSSVRSAGPPSSRRGRARPLPSGMRSAPPSESVLPAELSAPQLSLDVRRAPESAHAVQVAAHAAPVVRIRCGSTVRPDRAGAVPRSVRPVEVIAMNQTSDRWDVSTALQDVSNVPKRPKVKSGRDRPEPAVYCGF